MYSDQKIQIAIIAIDIYIREGLPLTAEDQLWIEFYKAPEWYDYFLTELHLVALFRSQKGENNDFISP